MLQSMGSENSGRSSILDKIMSEQQVSHLQDFKPDEVLNKLMQSLNEREREVLRRRFALNGGKPETLEVIGRYFRVTRERIRQIQRLATQRLRVLGRSADIVRPLRQVVVEVLEAAGGIAPLTRLQRQLVDMAGGVKAEVVNFLLDELLSDIIERIGGEGTQLVAGWRLRNASLESLQGLIDQAQEIISVNGEVMAGEELAGALAQASLTAPLGGPLPDNEQILNLLELSQQVRRNSFKEWGLAHWETVSPRRMNDKIYLVLKKAGQPLHFREIVRLINEQQFDRKTAYPPTIHNELILDEKYVLVGRGIYALREWGYKPGVVADVIIDNIRQAEHPLTVAEIVAKVLKQRVVKRGTIQLALTNRQRFQKLADGRYALADDIASPNNQTI